MSETTFRRLVKFEKGYNYLHETGPNRRGQHGMQIRLVLVGPHGATQFLMGTSWTPIGEVDGDSREPIHVDYLQHDTYGTVGLTRPPSGYDLGYHWRTPTYEGQTNYGPCEYLGADCYYDGSGLRADDLLRDFISQGEVAVWRALVAEYRNRLEGADEFARAVWR